jgi:hypothetical protein
LTSVSHIGNHMLVATIVDKKKRPSKAVDRQMRQTVLPHSIWSAVRTKPTGPIMGRNVQHCLSYKTDYGHQTIFPKAILMKSFNYCKPEIFSVHRITLFASWIDCICMMWLASLLYTLLSNVDMKNLPICKEQYHHSRRRRGCR